MPGAVSRANLAHPVCDHAMQALKYANAKYRGPANPVACVVAWLSSVAAHDAPDRYVSPLTEAHDFAAGLDAHDEQSGLHVMWSTTSEGAARLAEPLALK